MNNIETIEKKYAEAVFGMKQEWFELVTDEWYNYVIKLPIELQITYLLVILDNQVTNGGFNQYFLNGYGQFAKETISALITIGAIKKAELLEHALIKVNSNNYDYNTFRKKILSKQIESLFSSELLSLQLDKLDEMYYAKDDSNILQLLGDYLKE